MGFGLLFFGVLIAEVPFLGAWFPTCFLGYLLILAAVGKLRMYESTYHFAFIPLIPLILFSGFQIGAAIFGVTKLGVIYPGGTAGTVFTALFQFFRMLLRETLFFGTAKLAASVKLPKLRLRAVQNMVAYGIWFLFAVLQLTGIFKGVPGFDAALMIVYLLVTVFALVLYASSYRRICPEGEEDAPRRKSRFAFVNRFYEKLDKKEEQAAKESAKLYLEHKKGKKK